MTRNKNNGITFYVNVSTWLGRNDPEIQLRHLKEYMHQRGFYLEWEYNDNVLYRNSDVLNYYRLQDKAEKRNTNIILIQFYDRFARSPKVLVNALKEFQKVGIDLISNYKIKAISQKENVILTTPDLKQFENSLLKDQNKTSLADEKMEEDLISSPSLTDRIKNQIMNLYKQGKYDNDMSNRTKFEYGTSWK